LSGKRVWVYALSGSQGDLMPMTFGTTLINRMRGTARRWVGSALLVAAAAAPAASGVHAKDKDKPAREGKGGEAVAKKIDDTRLGSDTPRDKHPLAPVLDAARSSRESARKTKSYTATLIKQELHKKGPIRSVMTLKFRREPFSVYLKFIEPNEGREVIYVEGKNKGKLQVHEASGVASLIGTISLSPTGDRAMEDNRYPITLIGMEKLLDGVIAQLEDEMKHGECNVERYSQAKVGDVECEMHEVTHPKVRPHMQYQKTRVFIDKKTNLPIRLERYGFPTKGGEPPLLEEYTYTDLKLGVEHTDVDFDVNNDRYGFK
jgi:hypothetical protein